MNNFFKSLWKRHYFRLVSIGTLVTALLFGLIDIIKPNCTISIPINDEIPTKVVTVFLSLFLTYLVDKIIEAYRLRNKHYPHSYPIIKDKFPEQFSEKTVMSAYEVQNNGIDKIMKSPLEYALETLKGNQAPKFSPNDNYLEEIYEDSTKLIVAITAENPNLWLDPTLCFYFTNCCVVSLIKNVENGSKKMEMEHFENKTNNKYISFRNNNEISLDKLIKQEWDWTNDFNNFHFFRFFLYDGTQKDCFEKNVFPSLKASQDLFGIKSFFNEIEKIKNELQNGTENHLGDYYAHIDFIWDEIAKRETTPSFRKVINERKSKHLPEFLILFKTKEDENGSLVYYATVHTFVNGNPYSIEFIKDPTNQLRGYTIVQSLVSYLAKSVKNTEKYAPEDEFLNTKNSYIKWS